jgi:hypothetical protein
MRISRHSAKLWMCTMCAAVILGGAATTSAQMGGMFGGGAASQFKGIFNPVVGEGAEYTMTSANQQGGPQALAISVVGKEVVDGKTGYWLEITSQSARSGGTVYIKMLTMIDGENTQATKMIMQSPGRPPMEMDMQTMQSMQAMGGHQAAGPQSADISKRGQDMGSETVTVPAGTFTCEHYRSTEGDDVWVSTKVSPWGLVKMNGHSGTTMVLDKVVTDAKDMITGTPVQMQMPNMGGMGGPPQH